MHWRKVLTWSMAAGAALALTLVAWTAWAGPQWIDLTAEVTDEINLGAQKIRGQYVLGSSDAQPFFIQAFADAGECMRVDVETQTDDMELVVVAPNGEAWRNDDRVPFADLRPLIKIDPTPRLGFYTIQVSAFDGLLPTAEFRLKYGRYNSGSANCASPTSALTPLQAAEKAAK